MMHELEKAQTAGQLNDKKVKKEESEADQLEPV